MKIVKQIDDTHFEVEMEEHDKSNEIEVFVAHDYLYISMHHCFCTNLKIEGEYGAGASNCLAKNNVIQIPIRAAQEILKLLESNPYLKPEHLLKDNGEPNYLWNNDPIRFRDEKGDWKMVVREDKETEYHIIPLSLYRHIINNK